MSGLKGGDISRRLRSNAAGFCCYYGVGELRKNQQ